MFGKVRCVCSGVAVSRQSAAAVLPRIAETPRRGGGSWRSLLSFFACAGTMNRVGRDSVEPGSPKNSKSVKPTNSVVPTASTILAERFSPLRHVETHGWFEFSKSRTPRGQDGVSRGDEPPAPACRVGQASSLSAPNRQDACATTDPPAHGLSDLSSALARVKASLNAFSRSATAASAPALNSCHFSALLFFICFSCSSFSAAACLCRSS